MTAYYNEIEPYAAQWLRNLIAAGHIAPGDVDERSIEDVTPDDLKPYTQCHFFAGIGVWSYALRLAGWPDDRPVWTGSCPCQPFSAAGKGGGFADERHLWPAFHHLISQCRPPTVFGEQVASKDGLNWLDLVHADLEGSGYAAAAVDLCAAGVGAPHIRQRLWWMADHNNTRLERRLSGRSDQGREDQHRRFGRDGAVGELGDPESGGRGIRRDAVVTRQGGYPDGTSDTPDGLADAMRNGAQHGAGEGLGAQETPDGRDRESSGERLRPGFEGSPDGLADAGCSFGERGEDTGGPAQADAGQRVESPGHDKSRRSIGGLADADGGQFGHGHVQSSGQFGLHQEDGSIGGSRDSGPRAEADGLADAADFNRQEIIAGADSIDEQREAVRGRSEQSSRARADGGTGGRHTGAGDGEERIADNVASMEWPGPTNSFWRDADWLYCRDGKWRPVEPGTFPLAHGVAGGMVYVCATCLQTSNLDEKMRRLFNLPGRDEGRSSSKVLQPQVHGGTSRQDTDDAAGWTVSGATHVRGEGVPTVRLRGAEAASPSSGRGRHEQSPRQHRNPVRSLSCGEAPETSSDVDLRGVPNGISGAVTSEEEQAVRACDMCGGVGSHLFKATLGNNRVGKLRAYGNAIVPQVAAEVISAYLESHEE